MALLLPPRARRGGGVLRAGGPAGAPDPGRARDPLGRGLPAARLPRPCLGGPRGQRRRRDAHAADPRAGRGGRPGRAQRRPPLPHDVVLPGAHRHRLARGAARAGPLPPRHGRPPGRAGERGRPRHALPPRSRPADPARPIPPRGPPTPPTSPTTRTTPRTAAPARSPTAGRRSHEAARRPRQRPAELAPPRHRRGRADPAAEAARAVRGGQPAQVRGADARRPGRGRRGGRLAPGHQGRPAHRGDPGRGQAPAADQRARLPRAQQAPGRRVDDVGPRGPPHAGRPRRRPPRAPLPRRSPRHRHRGTHHPHQRRRLRPAPRAPLRTRSTRPTSPRSRGRCTCGPSVPCSPASPSTTGP